ncbi:hypothetical protein ELI61_29260, partial [Klebsiella pneumoniae]|nr:hypothetical protein [Klebsiella pneumoniae]
GPSYVNERGGEIMNLPRGTQIIPHDLSKRYIDRAADKASNGQNNVAGGFNINVNEMNVRQESDINKIAQQLDQLQKSRARGLGII